MIPLERPPQGEDIVAQGPGDATADEPLVRRSADLKRAVKVLNWNSPWSLTRRLRVCRKLIDAESTGQASLDAFFQDLTFEERHYWISSLYALLMPAKRRKLIAAYFTPPYLCRQVIDRMVEHGLDLSSHNVLDPAAGGAAFLVPLAHRVREKLAERGADPQTIVRSVEERLSGNDIEPGLTRLCHMLLSEVLREELMVVGEPLAEIVTRVNTLKKPVDRLYDAVISNPPYGRVLQPSTRTLSRWSDVISEGHVNCYALFAAAALERTRPGGLISLVIPTSLTAGPYFQALRRHIRQQAEIVALDLIERRSDVFVDVVQDTCVLVLRRRTLRPRRPVPPTVSIVQPSGGHRELGTLELPSSQADVWVLPSLDAESGSTNVSFFDKRLKTIGDYGYSIRSGYLVWNRSRDRLRNCDHPAQGEVPLIWAHCVRRDRTVVLSAGPRHNPSEGRFSAVKIDASSTAIIRGRAIIFHRTTNRNQPRRLIGGLVSEDFARKYSGYVTENHTIVVLPQADPKPMVSIETMTALLTSKAVDACFRRVSGTVSVSTKVLRTLPLPDPKRLIDCLAKYSDVDQAVRIAYDLTVDDYATPSTMDAGKPKKGAHE